MQVVLSFQSNRLFSRLQEHPIWYASDSRLAYSSSSDLPQPSEATVGLVLALV